MQLTKKQRDRVRKVYGIGHETLVDSFAPSGRSGLHIYAVTVQCQPDKVKVGRTHSWKTRRKTYANWNLAPGDGIAASKVFIITDEFVDLARLENHILGSMPLERAHGNEWFFGTVDEAARGIDRVMCEHAISYVF